MVQLNRRGYPYEGGGTVHGFDLMLWPFREKTSSF